MRILLILCILFLIFSLWAEVKANKVKGVLIWIFLIIGGVIAGAGNSFGFDGEIAALIFCGIIVGLIFGVPSIKQWWFEESLEKKSKKNIKHRL